MPQLLCLNAGSSSLKFGVYESHQDEPSMVAHGAIESIGGTGRFWIQRADGTTLCDQSLNVVDHAAAVCTALRQLQSLPLLDVVAVGHRVVHGGGRYGQPVLITDQVLDDLRSYASFAPLHQPPQLAVIERTSHEFPNTPQVACFDTAFHQSLPELAQWFPLPGRLFEQGLRRYGFHGLSYAFICRTHPNAVRGRAIIAHLGNGASLAAVRDGSPVDTTMGFSPAGGLMMGTRSGDLDPGVLIQLLRQHGYSVEQLDQLVNHESGLLGVSGLSADMRSIIESAASNPRATFALDLFCHILSKQIGALAVSVGGLDNLIFTGGIGEHSAEVRQRVAIRLNFLGVEVDATLNQTPSPVISTSTSRCSVHVITTYEELELARQTSKLLRP